MLAGQMINIFVELSAVCLADATAVPITFAIIMDDLIFSN
jgi:hypothetical protein